jgi:phosphoribosyl 1,2-cyclic phosphodiesterase
LGPDGVVLAYLQGFVEKFEILKKGKFQIGDILFEVPIQNIHSSQTYGLKFFIGDEIVSFVSDTNYFEELTGIYKDSTVLVLNVVFYQKRPDIQHLCLEEALGLIKKIKPKKAIITHFGMSMLKAKPHILEEKIVKETKMDIKFAYDGMKVDIPI